MFIEENLIGNETIESSFKIHYLIYMGSIFYGFLFTSILVCTIYYSNAILLIMTVLSFITFAEEFVKAFINKNFTEIAITSHRVILKTGFIKRKISEINLDRIESVVIDQSVLGRIFGFGTVIVKGVGVGSDIIEYIDNPLLFRKEVYNKLDN